MFCSVRLIALSVFSFILGILRILEYTRTEKKGIYTERNHNIRITIYIVYLDILVLGFFFIFRFCLYWYITYSRGIMFEHQFYRSFYIEWMVVCSVHEFNWNYVKYFCTLVPLKVYMIFIWYSKRLISINPHVIIQWTVQCFVYCNIIDVILFFFIFVFPVFIYSWFYL